MRISKTLYVTRRAEWRRWLERHHRTEPEVWLVYFRKETGKRSIAYNDAVEEALCFGWIDSNVKKIDEQRYAQRFSPRKSMRKYSQANKERLRRLAKQGKIMPSVLEVLKESDVFSSEFSVPPDILQAIMAEREAWKNFQSFPEAYKRIRIGFIEGARNRPSEFKKRLSYFIRTSKKNKLFGFGGIEAYYRDSGTKDWPPTIKN